MKVEAKKIGAFLKSLPDVDYRYLELCMKMRNGIQDLIQRHELPKEDVCQRFAIPRRKYNDFTLGNYNYTVRDMARLNAAFMELETEKLKESVPVQVVKS